jgi:hypothetical protein
MFASKSANPSASSANDGSSVSRGVGAVDTEAKVADWEARREERDGGRRGVVGCGGRFWGVRVREGVRERGWEVGVDILGVSFGC